MSALKLLKTISIFKVAFCIIILSSPSSRLGLHLSDPFAGETQPYSLGPNNKMEPR